MDGARDSLFACAGFAANQDGRVGYGDFDDHLFDAFDGVGNADDFFVYGAHLGNGTRNGIEQFIKVVALQGGEYKDNIEFMKGKGFVHAFNVAAEEMAKNKGGLTYALLANLTPNVRAVPLADKAGGPYYEPNLENVYSHKYPLSRYVYIYVNKKPGQPLEPKVKEFLKMVLSRQGQEVVARDGVYIPLTPEVVREELAKLEKAD